VGELFSGPAGNKGWTGIFNPMKDLLLTMDASVQLLNDYIK